MKGYTKQRYTGSGYCPKHVWYRGSEFKQGIPTDDGWIGITRTASDNHEERDGSKHIQTIQNPRKKDGFRNPKQSYKATQIPKDNSKNVNPANILAWLAWWEDPFVFPET